MTQEPDSEDAEPIDPELQRILTEERADEAWAEYVMNEQPSALARYLILGGEVNEVIRAALVDALRDHPGGRRGGSRPYRDWQTYLEIELMLKSDALDRILEAGQGGGGAGGAKPRPLTRQKALEAYAARTNQELRTVQMQYDRGRKVEAQFKKPAKD